MITTLYSAGASFYRRTNYTLTGTNMDQRAAQFTLLRDVLQELQRVDRLLHERLPRLQQQTLPDDGAYRGLYISDAEFSALLARPFGANPLQPEGSAIPSDVSGSTSSCWQGLVSAFHLTPIESDALLICLLPEIDLKYSRIFSYLQDDVTLKRPTVDLVLNLLCSSLAERVSARQLFTDEAPLLRQQLVIRTVPGGGDLPLLNHCLQLEPFLASFLLNLEPGALPPHLALGGDRVSMEQLALGDEAMAEARSLAGIPPDEGLWLHLVADRWSAQRTSQALCNHWGIPLLHTEVEAGISVHEQHVQAALARRESLLRSASLAIRLPDADAAEPGLELNVWSDALDGHPLPVIWSSIRANTLPWPLKSAHVARLHQHVPGYASRLDLWQQALTSVPLSPGTDLTEVAGRYRLNGDQIQRASQAARHAAWQRQPAHPSVQSSDLFSSARTVSSSHLGQLARRVEPRHRWQDLILPEDRLSQLHEMCDQFRYRHIVFDEWDFARHVARGRGLSALFAGPSGTGKTMAAEVIAGELELDLYKIDLSGVVSKYIGETEKNLERIFGQAQDSNAILFFDEADALFGKRSETKDAHDRYANIEISYLLQKIEEYDGVVILTSNLRQNLDEAFLRRLQFAIEFPFPDEDARLRIWQQILPASAPLAQDVELSELAVRFKFSGGSIRNVLLSAAFLAARDGKKIAMGHLLWAARREFQKMGKLVDESQFIAASR
jgi:hypothetical protein